MFLLDTNVLLELFLDQERAVEVEAFLRGAPVGSLFISDFALYSIAIVLIRQQRPEAFLPFVEDLQAPGGIGLLRLDLAEVKGLPALTKRLRLDFDDAYQYRAAELHNLALVSYDADFDATPRGRKTPAALQAKT